MPANRPPEADGVPLNAGTPHVDGAPRVERRRPSRLLKWYFALKYRVFRRERRPRDERRGLVMLQIDALAYAELRRAIELGYCPTIEQMVREEGYTLRGWFCGLPSATPYCQAGFFHGENDGIPAFRFYDKAEQRVITCNTPAGVQYIRDRITAPGALAGGSSYVNLLDGDAQNVAFTVATRAQTSVFARLGGWRMAMLMLIHPIRVLRMGVQAALEWLREDYERSIAELTGRRTHSEGLFPFIRVLTGVIVRELQTMAVLLDVYLGVPVIYSTFMQYDELGHHFGPASFQALRDLRRTDARIREIRRMIRNAGGRQYDLVILSDHGMTPSVSYRVRFGETLGTTVEHILQRDAARTGERALSSSTSFAQDGEYADMSARVVDAVAEATPERHRTVRGIILRARDWVRSKYGLRELILPEKYRVEAGHDVVVTYSSDLALLYFADDPRPLDIDQIADDRRKAALYDALLDHPGVGLLAARNGTAVHVESRTGRAILDDGVTRVIEGANPLEPYGTSSLVIRALERLVSQPNTGDLTIFGAYDGYEIVSFDDQIGAHGAAGGNQLHPFLIGPPALDLDRQTIDDPRDVHRVILSKYVTTAALAFVCLAFGGMGESLRAQQPARRDTTGVIAGRVVDAERGERRAGTAVSVVGTTQGAIADSDGRFVIRAVAAGDRTIRAHLLGYATLDRAVVVRAGDTTRIELRLQAEAQVLNAVKTEARPIDRELFDSRPAVGTVQITARAAEGVPKLGDPDVLRIVQLLPGVEARNDFSTGFNVRGGEADQNLILLDGYPIYNPFHVGGLFSTFIDPTVGDITLMTGGFPARYGSRLSSVLDVHSAEEPRAG
ncbi:MAG TPA: carboxypeptidase-like regulatory domain-containing protein, partial [Gemmatimonadaceae bacterium]|nr:carboxypeptidase-like regulatory domain-containing protein [Gemmatimonadaceae bacterium]